MCRTSTFVSMNAVNASPPPELPAGLAEDLVPGRPTLRRRHADRPSERQQVRRTGEHGSPALDPENN